jgi:hypothetical protein
MVLAVAAVVAAIWTPGDGAEVQGSGPVVGGDLHAVFTAGERTFMSGHAGAGYSDQPGAWTQIASLDDKDAMGWAQTSDALLVGGHGGLYRSTDDGESFTADVAVPDGTDVHGLGAAGSTVYLSTPDQGLYVSTDGGETFARRGSMPALMGPVLVNPNNPDDAIAADMQTGAVRTIDGGQTWQPLGGPSSAMSVAQDPTDNRELVVIGMDDAAISRDGGRTWEAFDVPEATAAATYTPSGVVVVATLNGDRAHTYRFVRGEWRLES